MKRKDAFRKLRVICQRLDEVDPERFFVAPLRLYLFGSLLTDKPNPSDVDLLFKYRENPIDPGELVYRLSYGKPMPYEQAFQHLRRGMKMIRFASLLESVEEWMESHFFSQDVPVRLVWEPGLGWRQVVDEIEAHPLSWDEDLERVYKHLQETAHQIKQERGELAAMEWYREQVRSMNR